MSAEDVARLHPMLYVHLAYAVVWVLHFGFAAWIAIEWRRTAREERQLELAQAGCATDLQD